MTFQTITFRSRSRLSIDAKFDEDRSLRISMPRDSNFVVPPSTATVEEIEANEQIQAHLAAGDLTISLSPGVLVGWVFEGQGPGTIFESDAITLLPALPFEFKPTLASVLMLVTAGTGNFIRLGDNANAPIEGRIFTGGANSASRQFLPVLISASLEAGTPILALRDDGRIVYGDIMLQGLRLSI